MHNRTDPIALTGLMVSYAPAEDRLCCRLNWSQGTRDLLLTRKLTGELIGVLARRLARQAQNHVLFEHIDLTRGEAEPTGRERAQPGADRPDDSRRVDKLIVTPHRSGVTLQFEDVHGERYALRLGRKAAHRTLDALYRRSQAADWRLSDRVPWLRDVTAAIAADQFDSARH